MRNYGSKEHTEIYIGIENSYVLIVRAEEFAFTHMSGIKFLSPLTLLQAQLICRLALALLLHASLRQKLVLFSILVFKVNL